jgi:putative two-component system response regulator
MLSYAGTHFEPKLTELFARVVQECKASLPAMAMATSPTDRSDS